MRILLLVILSAPLFAFAADFVPIAPIPGGGNTSNTYGDLSTYFNSLFRLALAAGAVLAAIFIAIGGFEYIFSEAMETKKTGRERIVNAIYGLIILLLTYLILYVIGGENALNLDIFRSGQKL